MITAKLMLSKLVHKLGDHPITIATFGGASTAVQSADILTVLEKHVTAWLSIVILTLTLYAKLRKMWKVKHEKHNDTLTTPDTHGV